MPTYEFACKVCGSETECYRPIVDGPPKRLDCPACGKRMEQVIGPANFILRGGGWAGVAAKHGDDYRAKWKAVEAHEESEHQNQVARSEDAEVMKHRRMGKEASREFRARNAKKWERNKRNRRKGLSGG